MPTIPVSYVYKVSRSGRVLGNLDNVISDFALGYEINKAGGQIQVVVGQSADTSDLPAEAITTEAGDPILTEDGFEILTERTPDVVGNENGNALIRNDNDIEVTEFSDYYPNGHVVFAGYISTWEGTFGGNDNITITCLNYGTELDNTIIEAALTTDQTQTIKTRSMVTNGTLHEGVLNSTGGGGGGAGGGGAGGWIRIVQSFVVGGGVTNLAAFEVWGNAASSGSIGKTLYAYVYDNLAGAESATPSGYLAVASAVTTTTTPGAIRMAPASPLTVTPGATYYVTVMVGTDDNAEIDLWYTNTDAYASGAVYLGSYFGGSGTSWAINAIESFSPASDLYFKTYTSSGATNTTFTTTDPGTIISSIMDPAIAAGGHVTYTTSTVLTTGTTATYTFKINTLLEGIDKARSLAPANWYWFVDPATNILYFKSVSTTADFTIVKGLHIAELKLKATIENRKNVVYFTGGPTAGVNLFIKTTDTAAIAAGDRRGIERITDNRVTVTATGTTISQGFLDENSDEKYETTVQILSDTVNIHQYQPGKTIGFAGYGNFIDRLVLQIVRVNKTFDRATLTLGVLPRRASVEFEEVQRGLLEAQTVANPSTPS